MPTHYPQRKSPRLQGYDYAQAGAYFVTICTHRRQHLFGQITNGEIVLNECGQVAAQCWMQIPEHFPSVTLDLFVIMPNHIHGIIVLTDTLFPSENGDVGMRYSASDKQPPTLARVINVYKGAVTRAVRLRVEDTTSRVWQSRYHDHIIRNEPDLNRIRQYVLANPSRWVDDSLNT